MQTSSFKEPDVYGFVLLVLLENDKGKSTWNLISVNSFRKHEVWRDIGNTRSISNEWYRDSLLVRSQVWQKSLSKVILLCSNFLKILKRIRKKSTWRSFKLYLRASKILLQAIIISIFRNFLKKLKVIHYHWKISITSSFGLPSPIIEDLLFRCFKFMTNAMNSAIQSYHGFFSRCLEMDKKPSLYQSMEYKHHFSLHLFLRINKPVH